MDLKAPKELCFDGNLNENWKVWKQELTLYITATEKTKKSDEIKSSILLSCIGKKGREVYNTFTIDDENKMKFDIILAKFEQFFSPRKNVTFLRYKFLTCKQIDGQSFDEFITELKKLSEGCELGDIRESLIRDMLIIGIIDNHLRQRLLREPNLTLDLAIQYGHAAEETKSQAKILKRSTEKLNASQIDSFKSDNRRNEHKHNSSNDYFKNCIFCGGSHKRGSCPAYKKACSNCKRIGHFAKCCTKKSVRNVNKAETISSENSDSEDDGSFFIGAIKSDFESCNHNFNLNDAFENFVTQENNNYIYKDSSYTEDNYSKLNDLLVNDFYIKNSIEIFANNLNNSMCNEWNIILSTNGTEVKYKLDTGAEANVISISDIKKLYKSPKINPTKAKLSAYNGTSIPVVGCSILSLKVNDRCFPVLFIVSEKSFPAIIGLRSCTRLNLIKRIDIVNNHTNYDLHFRTKFKDCFGEVVRLKDEYHINLHPNSEPVIHATRRVPFSLREK